MATRNPGRWAVPSDGLHGVTAVAVMTGAAPVHALAPEVHLRPLLVELGAVVPTRSLFVMEPSFEDLGPTLADWGKVALPILSRALGLSVGNLR